MLAFVPRALPQPSLVLELRQISRLALWDVPGWPLLIHMERDVLCAPPCSINLCAYSFVAAGVGWVVSIVLLLAQVGL